MSMGMIRRVLGLVAVGLAASAPPAASGGQDMVLGRQVAARADAPAVAATRHARSNYVLHCGGCHGMDGAGSQLGNVPDMRSLGQFLRVPGGREFVIKVPGVMGSGLNDAQVAEVTNWTLATLARASVPADHRPYDAGEVAQARASPIVDVASARRRLVEQARTMGIAIE
jgi:mono/diheme cytochrome c family protein